MDTKELPLYMYQTHRDEPSGEYVATCVEIPDLSGVGETPAEATQELKEAIVGWLEVLEEMGTPFPPAHCQMQEGYEMVSSTTGGQQSDTQQAPILIPSYSLSPEEGLQDKMGTGVTV